MNVIDKIYRDINNSIIIKPKGEKSKVDPIKLKSALFQLVGVVDELRKLEHWCGCGEEKK